MTSSTRTLILLMLTVLLGAGLTYEIQSISSAQKKIAEVTDTISQKIGSDSRTRSITIAQATYKEDLEVIDDVVLTKSDLATLLEDLQKIGRDKGLEVTVSSITSDSPKSASSTTPETVHVTFDASGQWTAGLSFIRLLENLPHKIFVERANINHAQDQWGVSVTLKLTTNPEK